MASTARPGKGGRRAGDIEGVPMTHIAGAVVARPAGCTA